MNSILKTIGLVLTAAVVQSCSLHPEEKNFIGTWASNDGAVIEFKDSNLMHARNIDLDKIFYMPNSKKGVVTLDGTWNFDKQKNIIDINGKMHHFTLEVAGQGPLGNKPPYNLVAWVGDPEDMIKYEFVKK